MNKQIYSRALIIKLIKGTKIDHTIDNLLVKSYIFLILRNQNVNCLAFELNISTKSSNKQKFVTKLNVNHCEFPLSNNCLLIAQLLIKMIRVDQHHRTIRKHINIYILYFQVNFI